MRRLRSGALARRVRRRVRRDPEPNGNTGTLHARLQNLRLEPWNGCAAGPFYGREIDHARESQVMSAWRSTRTAKYEREPGTACLDEAVTAYRDALLERTRERVPLDWAATQNNLGLALLRLGEREPGTARLEEAVTAYCDALLEYTRERVPLNWAMTKNNLGNALSSLSERESGTARLEEAVTAYRDALRERTRERVPLDWAMTQNNLDRAVNLLRSMREAKAHVSAPTIVREELSPPSTTSEITF
jgi:hypothetical protein